MRNSFGRLFCGICLLLTTSCVGKLQEQQRVSNPANTIDAVLAAREPVPTVAVPTMVHIVRHGLAIDEKTEAVFQADHVAGMQLRWKSDDELVIHAKAGRLRSSSANTTVDLGYRKTRDVRINLDIDNFEPLDVRCTPNPSNKIEAWWYVTGTNDHKQFLSEAYLCPVGKEPTGEPVFKARNARSLEFIWNGNHNLTIRAKNATGVSITPSFKVEISPGQTETVVVKFSKMEDPQ